jgi:ABC-type polysaccharide/polyol phosphate export permease
MKEKYMLELYILMIALGAFIVGMRIGTFFEFSSDLKNVMGLLGIVLFTTATIMFGKKYKEILNKLK